MDILEYTKPIKKYFLSMNIAEGFIYINVKFPNDWSISNEEIEKKFNVSVCKNEDNNGYYFFTKVDEDSEVIKTVFDAISYTINFNKEAEEKKELMDEKIKELIQLFVDEDIKTLKTLEFKLKKRNKTTKKNTQTKIEENNNEDIKSEAI